MSQNSDQAVDIEIQKTLISINELTMKIKRELMIINDLVKPNGPLSKAVNNSSQTLATIAQKRGLVLNETSDEDDDGGTENLIPAVPDYITEQLMSIIHGENSDGPAEGQR